MDSNLKAIIFDLDGVLIDSTVNVKEAFISSCRQFVSDPESVYLQYARHPGRSISDVLNLLNLPEDIENIFVKESLLHTDKVSLIEGIYSILRRLRNKGLSLAIATSKDRIRTEAILQHLQIGALFDCIYTASDVTRAKPHPEIVLETLSCLSVEAESALFVGDSINDIKAGKMAGVKTAAVFWGEGERQSLQSENANIYFESTIDFQDYIASS